MATTANTTNQESILKKIHGDRLYGPLYARCRLAMLCGKDTNFGGEGRYVTVTTTPVTGGSATFSNAQANFKASVTKRFDVEHKNEYQLFRISGPLIARSRGNANAMIDALKQETQMALQKFGESMAARIWGNEGGSLGQVDGTASDFEDEAYLVLTNPSDSVKFRTGEVIRVANNNGTGSNPAAQRTGSLTITGVDHSAGTLHFATDLKTGIAAIADNDFIFRDGDFAQAMTGVPGWCPQTAPTSAPFFGVDRTDGEVVALSGYRFNGNGGDYVASIISAVAEGQALGIHVTHLWVNPRDWAEIAKEVDGKEVRISDDTYKISFKALELATPDGSVQIISEPYVPYGYAWANDPSEIFIRTAGDCPTELKAPGSNTFLRMVENADEYEGRLGAYGNVFVEKPGNSIQITW